MAGTANNIEEMWIVGGNGKLEQFGNVTLVAGTAFFNTTLGKINAWSLCPVGTTIPTAGFTYTMTVDAKGNMVPTNGTVLISSNDVSAGNTAALSFWLRGV